MAERIESKVEVGAPAPDFCLPSNQGDEVCLAEYRGKSRVLLFFVREHV
jgi:peroxiredoxin